MGTVVACKLPHGLTINHMGQTININGTNADFNALNPAANGVPLDSASLAGGFGLTTISDQQSPAFADWCDRALYKTKDGKASKENGLLDEPFVPLQNGSILTFKSEDDARKEARSITGDVVTGYEGLDGDAEMKAAAESAGLIPEAGVSERAKA